VIKMFYPKESEDRYFHWHNMLWGPSDTLGALSGEVMPFKSALESIEESRGIFRENDVTHQSIVGDIMYHPILGGVRPTPTAQYPRSVEVAVYGYDGKTPRWIKANAGIASDKGSTMIYSSTVVQQYAYERDPITNRWTVYEMWAFATNPGVITNVYKYVFKTWPNVNNTFSAQQIIVDTGTGGIPTNFDLTKQQSFATIKTFVNGRVKSTGTSTGQFGMIYRAYLAGVVFKPKLVRDQINMLVASLFPEKFPIEDKHYGELAQDASELVNKIRINMIAFLRDLRHPTEMIPKLKNLKSLKSIANDFLSVKYGILPTISDVENIVGTFKRHGPYVDSNGFDTYSASFRDELTQDGLSFTLEQHIKLAIGEEDSEFGALISRLDSMGTLPTFQNLWDLVPYSFVIDWLVDVGGFLERIDARLRLSRLNIAYATMSRKASIIGTLASETVEHPFTGSIEWVHYHRWVSDQCPVPPLPLQSNIKDFDHWLESSALLIQRAKH
jgi:hypothetical protein